MLKPVNIDLETGISVCIINESDAKKLGVERDDRLILTNPSNRLFVAAVVDLAKDIVKSGEIGISSSIKQEIELESSNTIEVTRAEKPESFQYIIKKINNQALNFDEIKQLVEDIRHNKLSVIELTAYMTAVKINGYNIDEIYAMAKNMSDNGKKLNLNVDGTIVDKHSIGGINGRATMIIVPIVSCFDELYIPKTSSRAITSSSGTADSMEVLANVNINSEQLQTVVEKCHGAMVWGGAFEFAPVDDKIIKIERPLQMDPQGQVIASVLSKKLSVGARKVIVDVPMGKDTKVKNLVEAEDLSGKFVATGKKLGMEIRAVITDASTPCGNTFGPALEARSVLEILEGKTYDNLAEKACELAGELLEMCNVVERGQGYTKSREILKNGRALKKMKQIIETQGKKFDSSDKVPIGEFHEDVFSTKQGYVRDIGIANFTQIALASGAPFDKGSGVMLMQKQNNSVDKGDLLFKIFADNKDKLNYATNLAKKIEPVKVDQIILEEIN
ncbi:MAG: thymidine phosphorylase [Candidatus Diapherotrites archaeon CG08_land_8_20_14_0_20_30_16]|nr:MAG: thymidine phosphorylase [Candidatus Diapherotrites archaeon CG08_land_8_20_14_0_20_30_16]